MSTVLHSASRRSALIAAATVGYVVVVIIASAYPLSGWRLPDRQLLWLQLGEWPRYYTYSDVIANVLAYVPVGGLLTWWLRHRLGPVRAAGLAMVMAGNVGAAEGRWLLGIALAFASAVSYAIYLVLGSGVIARVGSMRFTAYALSIACVLCIVQFVALRPLAALDVPPMVYGLGAAMGIGCTVIPTFMTSEALKRVGANHTAIVGSLGPVITIVLGWIGLDESMTRVQIFGTLLVLGGVLMVSLKPQRPN